jgi:hypothetical protein
MKGSRSIPVQSFLLSGTEAFGTHCLSSGFADLLHGLCAHTAPLVMVLGEFLEFPCRDKGLGADNVGLVSIPDENGPFAEFNTLFVSDKLLQKVSLLSGV